MFIFNLPYDSTKVYCNDENTDSAQNQEESILPSSPGPTATLTPIPTPQQQIKKDESLARLSAANCVIQSLDGAITSKNKKLLADIDHGIKDLKAGKHSIFVKSYKVNDDGSIYVELNKVSTGHKKSTNVKDKVKTASTKDPISNLSEVLVRCGIPNETQVVSIKENIPTGISQQPGFFAQPQGASSLPQTIASSAETTRQSFIQRALRAEIVTVSGYKYIRCNGEADIFCSIVSVKDDPCIDSACSSCVEVLNGSISHTKCRTDDPFPCVCSSRGCTRTRTYTVSADPLRTATCPGACPVDKICTLPLGATDTSFNQVCTCKSPTPTPTPTPKIL